MDEELLLTVLKQDLKTPPSEEPFLRTLLKQAEGLMKREGIQDDGAMDYQYAIAHYAAFLYRKRASKEMVMTRFLRYELNNLLYSEKERN